MLTLFPLLNAVVQHTVTLAVGGAIVGHYHSLTFLFDVSTLKAMEQNQYVLVCIHSLIKLKSKSRDTNVK